MDKDSQKEIDEYNKKYGQECLDELKAGGFKTEGLTPSQAVLILEPSHAPENFYCDGEISHYKALDSWKHRMMISGISALKRVMAEEYIFG